METQSNNQEQLIYEIASKKVKKISGFYRHLAIYCVVNAFLLVINYQNTKHGESFFQAENFATALFWGIGLTAHGLSVFGPNIFFGPNWEERKIKQIMEKEQKQTQKWN